MQNDKPLGTVLAETKEELKEFLGTRLAILQAEIQEKAQTWKYSVPLLLLALALLLAGWITLTFAFVALLHSWLEPNIYSWTWAALIVAGIYLIGGVAVGWFAYSEISTAGVAPKRTLTILKQDQAWLQKETRAA
ncbi:MAG TPA: phage holin family protein [Candidatus Angelobacter sp.]